MKNKSIPPKVTFECTSMADEKNEPSIGFQDLKADTEESIIRDVPHRYAKRTCWGIISGIFVAMVLGIALASALTPKIDSL